MSDSDSRYREHCAFLEEIEAVAQSGGFSYAIDGSHLRGSPQVYRMLGLDPATPPSLELLMRHVHPDDRAILEAGLQRHLHTAEPLVSGDFRMRRGDGDDNVRWIRAQSSYFPADAKGPARVVGVLRDVTDERAIADALRASEDRFRAVVESGMVGIFEWDGARIVHANDAFLRIIGNSRADLEAGIDRASVSLPEPGARPVAKEYRRKDGSRVPVLVGGARLRADGERGVAFVIDESERRDMQTRLAQADRLASMGAMAAAVAHELNNPLAYVTSNLTFLAESLAASPDRAAELLPALSDARHGAERMREIVGDLSTFSKVDELVTAPVDVNRAVESALNLADNELRHRARVVKQLPPLPAVRGNEARITQVLVNILINAAQAMPEGEADRHQITVTTSLRAAGADGRARVSIEVRDDGSGIAPEVLPRIFDPFFTTKPVGDGTGLGLSIAHRLVTSLGGEIEVESDPGRGATFRVLLEPVAAAVPPPEPARPAPAITRRRARVIVLDDEPMVGTAIRRMLANEHDVTALTRPQDLLTLLANESIDVLLCDLMMPLMTGMDVYAELQARFPSLVPRVVFLTGGAFTARAKSFLAEVGNARLDKPFDAAKLRALVRSIAG